MAIEAVQWLEAAGYVAEPCPYDAECVLIRDAVRITATSDGYACGVRYSPRTIAAHAVPDFIRTRRA